MGSLFYDSNFLTAASFAIFLGILYYAGVHRLLFKMLDDRADKIRADLDRARELREEAQARFAEIERKRAEVDTIAEEIVTKARADAEAAAAKAEEDIQLSVARRLKAAEEQIALAEAQAVRQVQSRAVEVAVAAAGAVIAENMDKDASGLMIDSAIAEVGARLH
ncbi:MAG: ATP F0F1 synthase subunit B [Pseudomonadota bacterium]